jgi:hypothetical protein
LPFFKTPQTINLAYGSLFSLFLWPFATQDHRSRDGEESYQDLLVGNEKKPNPSIEAVRNVQKLMAPMNPKVAGLKPEEIVEPRIIRRLDESGFIDALYDSKKG